MKKIASLIFILTLFFAAYSQSSVQYLTPSQWKTYESKSISPDYNTQLNIDIYNSLYNLQNSSMSSISFVTIASDSVYGPYTNLFSSNVAYVVYGQGILPIGKFTVNSNNTITISPGLPIPAGLACFVIIN